MHRKLTQGSEAMHSLRTRPTWESSGKCVPRRLSLRPPPSHPPHHSSVSTFRQGLPQAPTLSRMGVPEPLQARGVCASTGTHTLGTRTLPGFTLTPLGRGTTLSLPVPWLEISSDFILLPLVFAL